MKNDLIITHTVTIPEHEIEIITSKSGGPGGQHANKTDTRITLRWNAKETTAISGADKERLLQKLQSMLTTEGELIIHNSASRSQQQNKKMAFASLAEKVRDALHIPKKRTATKISAGTAAARLRAKAHRSTIKKMRATKQHDSD